MSLSESIKKLPLKYVKCLQGGLHSGQVMNMICVDSNCNRRGLICPICRMQQHQNHQILPIKTFLEHIRIMFGQNQNNDELNNLTDYLRALENAKKNILCSLKNQVKQLADCFQSLEVKIQENFTSVRRNVMIQSSITTKLPSLLTLLTEQNIAKDPDMIQQQFKKYTELLKYENEKLIVSDKAKSLVQSYATIPTKLQNLLSQHSSEFMKKLETLPKFFVQKQAKSELKSTEIIPVSSYTFSSDNKYFDIILQQENKVAITSEQCSQGGYVFVNENKGLQKQKIAVQILMNGSSAISLGLGDVDFFKDTCSFINEGLMDQKTEAYDYIYCDGRVKQDSSELIEFDFNTGDIVEIQYNGVEIIYLNRRTQKKHVNKSTFSQISKKNLQFVFGLFEGDQIKIVDV